MNRINPLHIALLMVALFGFVIYQHLLLQKKITQKEQRVLQLQEIGKEIATLKNYWGDKRLQKRRIEEIINTPFIKKFVANTKQNRDRYKVWLKNIDAKNADRIADKIFNSFVKIGSFSIQREGKDKISMEVEFRL
ncbi:MAG: hypothetical protein GXO16_05755 [Epsilonproteobacteria bacterium]|nr:hypothetical protein [Campylobacterota bacterium]